jgi:Uroporphyrinogen-III decarboxylase
LLDVLVDATAQYLADQLDAGVEVVQIFDTWAGVLPEDGVRRFVFEPTRATIERLRDRTPGRVSSAFPGGSAPFTRSTCG